MNLVPLLHLFIPFIQSSYCFLFKKNKFDILYIWINYFILLHWTFLNGECILGYYHKKKNNPNYIAGEDSLKNDFHIEYKEHEFYMYLLSFLFNFFLMINTYIILKRNHYSVWFSLTFIILYEIYFYGCFFFQNHYKNKSYLFFQEIIKYLSLVWAFIFMMYS